MNENGLLYMMIGYRYRCGSFQDACNIFNNHFINPEPISKSTVWRFFDKFEIYRKLLRCCSCQGPELFIIKLKQFILYDTMFGLAVIAPLRNICPTLTTIQFPYNKYIRDLINFNGSVWMLIILDGWYELQSLSTKYKNTR